MSGKRSIFLSAFMALFAMLLLLLSALGVSAREQMEPGLILGWPEWENGRPRFSENKDDYTTEAWFQAGYAECTQIGWIDEDGNVTPISLDNADKFTLIPEGGGTEEFTLEPQGEWEYDPDEGREVFKPSGDGLFDLSFMKLGSYTLLYQGPETQGAAGDFSTVAIEVELPPVGLYSENRVSGDTLLGTKGVLYSKGSEFYILGHNSVEDLWKEEVSDIRCDVQGLVDVDLTPVDNGFKVTIQGEREDWLDIQVFFTRTFSRKEDGSSEWIVEDTREEDRWINFMPAPRKGLAVGWPENSDDGPVFVENEQGLKGWIDRRASYMDWLQIAWIGDDGSVTRISPDNLEDFSFTSESGGDFDVRIEACGEWRDDPETDEDEFVPFGDGFFNLGFLQPGKYTMTYSGPETAGADADVCSVAVEVVMPPVGLYAGNEVAPANLLWMNGTEYKAGSEFYFLPNSEIAFGEKQEATDLTCELNGGRYAELTKSGDGYKLTVSEDMNDWFNVQIRFTYSYSHYDEEAGGWIVHHSHEENRGCDFSPMEKYGLMIGYADMEQIPGEEDRAVFSAEDMKSAMEIDVYDTPSISLGWKDADGTIRPIPQADIDKFKAYDAQGKEISDWIWPHTRWNVELKEVEESGDGLFVVQFKGLGKFRIEYEGETIPADVDNMTNSVSANVVMPLVGIYKTQEAAFANLICPDDETRDIFYTNKERVFYINVIDYEKPEDHKATAALLPDEIELDGPPEESDGEWESRVAFELMNDHCIKVTVLPGYEEPFSMRVPFIRTDYWWDQEHEVWVKDDEWGNDRWFNFNYEKNNDISTAKVNGFSLSYGYSGKAYTPAFQVVLDGVTLRAGTDYTYQFRNNKNPGTATLTITGIGEYTGTRIKTFEIVDCVSSLVNGKTYQLIPKNNSKTAVSSFGGRMVNNTKVYITDRSNSEAMKFKAIKNADGTWKFINAKCELALAVQQNSSALGAGLVLYDQTTRKAQNWKLSKKSDNSFAIMNAVTGYSIAMSDASAARGTTLSMAETASSGLQRFYLAETSAVSAPFDGTKSVRAAKDKTFGLNIASASKSDGANVNLYKYSNVNEKKFKIMYSGGGYYRLVNVNSGLVVSVKGNTKANGANVIQSRWAGESGQRWKFKKNSDGSVTLTNALGTVLHLNGNKTANGTNVIAKTAATTTAQRWYLQ